MYGFTHRGGNKFKIGDRLFDSNYKPVEEDYTPEEWSGFLIRYNEVYGQADDFEKKWIDEDGISYVIPFKQRGSKVIETMEEAYQAAVNMSNYLS